MAEGATGRYARYWRGSVGREEGTAKIGRGLLRLFAVVFEVLHPLRETRKVDDDFSRLWNTRESWQVETTDFLVDSPLANVNRTKTNLSRCQTAEGDVVLVRVEQFAFTANNMTYALIGALTGWYWDFFLAPRGWGRIPVLGVWQSRRIGSRQCENWRRSIRLLSHVDARCLETGEDQK